MLEKIFKEHFRPAKHNLIETEKFLKTKKARNQTVSHFYTQIKKKGNDLSIEPVLIRQAFCQGLDKETQKHCALRGSQSLEDYYLAAIEFEKISEIGKEVDQQQSLAVEARLEQNKIN